MPERHERLLVLFGNQLFPTAMITRAAPEAVFMAESERMCRRYRSHQHKLVLVLSAMRSKAEALRKTGCRVHYETLCAERPRSFSALLEEHLAGRSYTELVYFETESPSMQRLLERLCEQHGMARTRIRSPMFLTSREEFSGYRKSHRRLFLADFYRWQRKRLGVLLDDEGKPVGGQWSFDAENRKKLPKGLVPPTIQRSAWTKHTRALVKTVSEQFATHPGDASTFYLPTTESQAEEALSHFLEDRFRLFGDYEDALSRSHATLFHSLLSPLMNIGLLTPERVVDRALRFAADREIPINSVEGFVRQIIGWRELVRGVWNTYPESHWKRSFWGHDRKLTKHWYEGTTEIPPLDDVIRRANATGYNHHIERLMVAGNLMLLCRVAPLEAYRWFMEMYVDSADWVMAPNVYGMALFSEGGSFTTKPYICGSNYLRKMSDYPKGPWCDMVDGLYWSFVHEHRDFFSGNPRSKVLLKTLDRMDTNRKDRLFALGRHTRARITS